MTINDEEKNISQEGGVSGATNPPQTGVVSGLIGFGQTVIVSS